MSRPPHLLQTRRLGARRCAHDDLQAAGAVFADPCTARLSPAMNATAALECRVAWNLCNHGIRGCGQRLLKRLEAGALIGDAVVDHPNPEGERLLDIGWPVQPDFRASGCATEAAARRSIVDPANMASVKVATRVHEGRRGSPSKCSPLLQRCPRSA